MNADLLNDGHDGWLILEFVMLMLLLTHEFWPMGLNFEPWLNNGVCVAIQLLNCDNPLYFITSVTCKNNHMAEVKFLFVAILNHAMSFF